MNQRFLRDEAARFRAMAEETDRESTRLRLLAMAADYENRSKAAHDLAGPAVPAPEPEAELTIAPVSSEPRDAEPGTAAPGVDAAVAAGPARLKTGKLKLDRQSTRDTKETIMVERRPSTRRA